MEVKEQITKSYQQLIHLLLKEQNEQGFWTGRLSSSALSTAVSIAALKMDSSSKHHLQIERGLAWLLEHVNADGGYGDTPESNSNVSTSLLSYAAIHFCQGGTESEKKVLKNLENYLLTQNIGLKPEIITSSVLQFYGKDYTFSVPILSMMVICGVLDESSCRHIPQLPFELVLLPSSWYSFFNLRVVSYALPALIAMGIFIFKKRSRHNPVMGLIRNKAIAPSLQKLLKIMPESGGFLEATPLTGFVNMCLISAGFHKNEVVERGISFLICQQRKDGSWPIDTDLSTWVTTLSIKAMGPDSKVLLTQDQIGNLRKHLLSIQYKTEHSFNSSLPGGWGWTNYSGSVPDVDDTCGAVLALLELFTGSQEEIGSIIDGCKWLLAQQNSDGGFPTFCRGWGRLPFDSSCSDLTGHAFCALMKTVETLKDNLSSDLKNSFCKSALRGLDFLKREQQKDGAWLPLWFGNQLVIDKTNPVYGTAKVSIYLKECLNSHLLDDKDNQVLNQLIQGAEEFLLNTQNDDGSWGGGKNIAGSVEETSLAIGALASKYTGQCLDGLQWLSDKYQNEGLLPSPIGLYFAALWYDEKLYPLIYYIEALRRIKNAILL